MSDDGDRQFKPVSFPDEGRTTEAKANARRNAIPVIEEPAPVPIRLPCPRCGELHVDEGEWSTRPHHTHACQHCGEVWRPAVVCTVGVRFLPGFRSGGTDG